LGLSLSLGLGGNGNRPEAGERRQTGGRKRAAE
jgi:hypothetical protein